MIISPRSFRSKLMLFSACSLVCGVVPALRAAAAPADGSYQVAQATAPATSVTVTSDVIVKAKKLLLREKNSPSAVTELGQKAIDAVGVGGSTATLLRQAPSIFVYQNGLGNNEPVLTVRGVRGLETAQTLDDVPMQDLLNGGTGAFLANIIGGRFNLDQISGVTIYPGVAYPDKNTFGTIGGTIAYQSKRPDNDAYIDVSGAVGSFQLYNESIVVNSGSVDSVLGTGDNAAKFLAQYSNEQSAGYVDNTPSRYNNFEFAFDKPYADGLSKFQATILYNTANALYTPEAVPVPYLNINGVYSNYPTSVEFSRQTNDYFTGILKDEHYVNDFISVGGSLFYENSNSTSLSWGTPGEFQPGGVFNPYGVNVPGGQADPFIQVPASFGYFNGNQQPGGAFYDPQAYYYNAPGAFPAGSKGCPAAYSATWVNDTGSSPCGLNAQLGISHTDTYGLSPHVTFTPPEIFGITNTIKFGGTAAKETEPSGPTYYWGSPNVPQTAANLVGGYDGGVERTIYQGYLQDKIDLLDNSLHITPGATIEGTKSSLVGSKIFGGTPSASLLNTAYCQAGNPCLYGYYKTTKWDRDVLPFLNVSYDFDQILPAAKGLTAYGSTGQSALFAPVTDFSPNLLGGPPSASIVHLYEGGVKYDTDKLLISADYYYQNVDRDFGFFEFQSGPETGYSEYTNAGGRVMKGIEGSVIYQATPDLQLFGNASHIVAKYTKTALDNVTVQEEQFGLVIDGDPITGIPQWLATYGFDYTPHNVIRDGDQLGIRVEGQYTGHQFATYDLSGFQNVGKIPGVTPYGTYEYYNFTAGATTYDPHGGISAYNLFNLDLNYKLPTPQLQVIKNVTFDLNVQNLLNKVYYAYFYKQVAPSGGCGTFTSGPFKGQQESNYSCGPQFQDGIPGEPFGVIFTVTARF